MKNVEDIYPLTPSQYGLLYHAVQATGGGTYFEQFCYTLRGALDEAAFRGAWQRVVARHPALRTAFLWKGIDDALQVVRREAPLPWLTLEWGGLDEGEAAARLERYLAEDRRKGFRLEQAPLMRCALFRLADQRFHFVWSFHHALMDGWSFALVLKEVNALYAALAAGRPDRLAEAPLYRNYIAWLQGRDRAAAEAFWRGVLDETDVPGPVPARLPTTASSPTAPDAPPGEVAATLPAETTAALHALAREARVTMNVVLQAAWAILLARHTGAEAVCFGYGSSGRTPEVAGIEGMVGMLMGTLPMRVAVPAERCLGELLTELSRRHAAQEAWGFAGLAEIQRWAGLAPGEALFDSVVAYENYPRDESLAVGFCGFAIEALQFFERTTFPLVVYSSPGERMHLRLQFDRAVHDEASVAALAARLARLLESMIGGVGRRVAELEMLSGEERDERLAALASGDGPPPEYPTVAEWVAARAAAQPDAIAVEEGPVRFDYAALDAAAEALAARLRALGAAPGRFVALHLPRSAGMVIAQLAVMKSGAAFVPLDHGGAPARNREILADAAPVAVVVAGEEGALPPEIPQVVQARISHQLPTADADPPAVTGRAPSGLLNMGSAMPSSPSSPRAPSQRGLDALATEVGEKCGLGDDSEAVAAPAGGRIDPDSIAYMFYTSGSTGRPKGVPIRHGALAGLCAQWGEYVGLAPGVRASLLANPAFDASLLELWPALCAGAGVAVVPAESTADPATLRDWLLAQRIEVGFVPTPLFPPLLELAWPREGAPRLLVTGGDRLPGRPPRGLPFRLINAYGPTECTVCDTAGVLAPREEDDSAPDIGRPLPGIRAYVLDPHGHPAPRGAVGELCLGGPRVMPGYHGRPERTAAVFLETPLDPDGRVYRSGDRVRLRGDGRLAFLGRRDHQVKVRGVRIELGEVEAAIAASPLVGAAAVLLEETGGEAALSAFVEPAAALTRERGPRDAFLDDWRRLYENVYQGAVADRADPDWDLRGWSSSLTGAAIPADEMRAWVRGSVARLAVLAPRRVLEIGCGSGLLVQALAPSAERYHATDFAPAALAGVERRRDADPRLAHVTLERRDAHDFAGIEARSVDLVVLNSVVQYFSDADYLAAVLEGAVQAVADGGHVYVGDVRSLPLLDLFHAEAALLRLPEGTKVEAWRQAVEEGIEQEEELVLHPAFFAELAARLPRVGHLQVMPRAGGETEMARYRYDVLLHVGPAPALAAVSWSESPPQTAAELPAAAEGRAWRALPNRRLSRAATLRRWLAAPPEGAATVGDLRRFFAALPERGIDPDVAAERGETSWLGGDGEGAFALAGAPAPVDFSELRPTATDVELANTPWRGHLRRTLAERLRRDLAERLPDAFLPARFTVLERLPRTPAGKPDRRALRRRGAAASHHYVAPHTPTEAALAAIWAEVLGHDRVGVTDDFFALGGHSLSTTRVVSRIHTRWRVEVPLSALFERPTVQAMAPYLDALLTAASAPRQEGEAREVGEL
ncbi:class I SAM-dependent methyltransferase [Endothiovibrio diazotrophicus]